MLGGRGLHGTVTAISGTTITLKTDEGESYQVFTSANSHIMKERQPIKLNDIHTGDSLVAGGEVDAKAKTVGAVFVAVLTAEQAAQAKKMREDFGKTWTAGEVTSIKDTTITLKRLDGATQAVSVDENTSFKKRHDSITLADIQVGDRLGAQGAVKDGTFVATSVNVRGGEAGGEDRGQSNRQGPAGAPPPNP
ncbi:hypothetical protein ACPOL_0192 [Acidisarcina polymorpha]|uniref:DUF5666 domain-containing protein n=2 Tax=Acidisarcina polymorpha TaxID=2211140 RepID=A0A2Z5FSX5_9BACT|nr:hypothetical protein ACPOL_0192 [Acidisarcina polymorpha]